MIMSNLGDRGAILGPPRVIEATVIVGAWSIIE